ncbi:MAG: DNRLRE domain-containing protein [Thermoleophilaceae bacterium]
MVILVATMAALTTGAAVDTRRAESAARMPSVDGGSSLGRELRSERSRTSRTYATEQGEFVTRVYRGSVNYRRGNTWLPIDNSLVPARSAGYGYENAANRYRLLLPAELSAAPVRIEEGGEWVSYALEGAGGRADVEGGTATYRDVFPGVDAEYMALADSVKEALTLWSPKATSDFTFALRTSPGLRVAENPAGGVDFADGDGRVHFKMTPPLLYDSGSSRRATRAATLRVSRAEDGLVLVLDVDEGWLRAPERRFPVVVDPNTVLSPAADCFMSQSSQNTSRCGEELEVGWESSHEDRTLLRFDMLGIIPRKAVVISADLRMYVWSRLTTSPMPVSVHRVTKPWVDGEVTWNKYDAGNSWDSPGGDFDPSVAATEPDVGACVSCWHDWYPSELVQSWLDRSTPNRGMLVKGPGSSAANHVEFSSSEFDSQHAPYLDVKWKHRVGLRDHFTYEEERLSDRLMLHANVANGNLLVTDSDLDLAGTGLDLVVARHYNGLMGTSNQSFGRGWWMSTGRDVSLEFYGEGRNVRFNGPSGYAVPFRLKPDGGYTSPTGLDATLVKNANGSYRLTFHYSQDKLHFSSGGILTKHEDRNGNALTFAYNGSNDLTTITDTRGREVNFSVDGAGQVTQMTDPAGRTHGYGYTGDQLTTYTNPQGKATRYAYTGDQLTQITDPRGNVTKLAYDNLERVTQIKRVTDPAADTGPTSSFSYSDSTGPPCDPTRDLGRTTVTDERGNQTTYCFDRELRVTETIDARGKTRSASYTSNSNVDQYTSATGEAWNLTYDSDNRPTEAQQPAAAGQTSGLKSTLAYSGLTDPTDPRFHRPASATDTQGNRHDYGYDGKGNLESVTNQLTQQNQIQLSYNANGTVASTTDARGTVTTYGYNTRGERTSVNRPAPLADESYSYDSLSRLNIYTDGRGKTANYDYDSLDRVTSITYSDGSSVAYSYDANGNILSRTDQSGQTTYGYDKLNRLVEEDFPNGRTNTYTYDAAGNLTSLTDGGGAISYAYGPTNLLDSMRAPGDAADTTFAYDDDERRTSTAYPNGVTMSQSYDEPGRLKEIKATKGGSTLTRFSYTYTKGTQDTSLRQSVTDHDGETTSYTYDALDRLTRAQDTAGGSDDYQYSYDGNSNITQRTKNGTATSYSYNAANQLTSAGSTSYSYDAAGNLTGSSAGLAGSYNDKGQMTSFTPPGGSARPMSYAGPNQFERLTSPDQQFTHNVLGIGVRDWAGRGTLYYTFDDRGKLASERLEDGSRHYYLFDGLGSVAAVTDASGNVGRRHSYDPYGRTTSSGTTPNPWRYAGQYQDSGQGSFNGLYKMGMRYYDPNLGRWTQQDPIDNPADVRQANRYVYVGADPLNLVDPLGLHACPPTIEANIANCEQDIDQSQEISALAGAAESCITGYFVGSGAVPLPGLSQISGVSGCAGGVIVNQQTGYGFEEF